jgi:serine protease Do
MQELTDKLREGKGLKVKSGVLITEVVEGSPAEEAGLQEGDVVVAFNGKEVDSPDALQDLVADTAIGDQVKIKIVRGDRQRTLDVTMGEWDDSRWFGFNMPDDWKFSVADLTNRFRLGVRVSELNGDLAPYFGVDEGEGMLVLGVDEESTANEMGIKSGDVIVGVAGKEIESVDDIHKAMGELEEGEEFEVTVIRKKKHTTLKGEAKEGAGAYWFNSRSFNMPRVQMHRVDDDLRKEIDELREEIEELRQELKKSKSD